MLAIGVHAGCAMDEAPAQPSWQVDVMPVLAANCVRCHGFPTNGLATFGIRFDAYDDTEVVGVRATSGEPPVASIVHGAAASAGKIAHLASRKGLLKLNEFWMPPGRQIGDYEYTVLRNWTGLVDGSGKAPRGPGRPDNAPPVLTLEELERTATTVTLAYELRDADRDLVVGSLRGPIGNLDAPVTIGVIGDLVTGRGTFTLDLTNIPPGSYDLVAQLDDGADIDGPDGFADFVEVAAGSLVVP
ncbi:MAG: hypothetical protein H0T79_18940 [Deltaproteobacteria bacterium]|nr:hypothetical protein [Deltaproteobacteria bacterium]